MYFYNLINKFRKYNHLITKWNVPVPKLSSWEIWCMTSPSTIRYYKDAFAFTMPVLRIDHQLRLAQQQNISSLVRQNMSGWTPIIAYSGQTVRPYIIGNRTGWRIYS